MVDPDFEFCQRQKSLGIVTSKPTVGPTQPSIERTLGAFWLGANRPGREADHSTTSSAKVKYKWSCTFTSLYSFMLCTRKFCLLFVVPHRVPHKEKEPVLTSIATFATGVRKYTDVYEVWRFGKYVEMLHSLNHHIVRNTTLCGSLSQRHGEPSDCGWRRWPVVVNTVK